MKQLFILIFLSISIFSNEDLYENALRYEKNGDYKNAMLIYKELALKEKMTKEIFVDSEKEIELSKTKELINTLEDEETEKNILQMLASSFDLYPYEENYFIPFSYVNGVEKSNKNIETKFQLSVKKPISHNILGFNETFYFGYTQTSWWQLYADSSPFRETNYRPEVFIMIPYGKKDHTSLKAFKVGLLHESNGQSESKSKSWNRLYLESYFQLSNLFINPKIWYRIPESESEDDNPDIHKYLGYGSLNFMLPYKNQTFKLILRNNLDFSENRGFGEFNWSFPLFNSKKTFGFVQISKGYGDSLIDYNKDIERFSFGISLSR